MVNDKSMGTAINMIKLQMKRLFTWSFFLGSHVHLIKIVKDLKNSLYCWILCSLIVAIP